MVHRPCWPVFFPWAASDGATQYPTLPSHTPPAHPHLPPRAQVRAISFQRQEQVPVRRAERRLLLSERASRAAHERTQLPPLPACRRGLPGARSASAAGLRRCGRRDRAPAAQPLPAQLRVELLLPGARNAAQLRARALDSFGRSAHVAAATAARPVTIASRSGGTSIRGDTGRPRSCWHTMRSFVSHGQHVWSHSEGGALRAKCAAHRVVPGARASAALHLQQDVLRLAAVVAPRLRRVGAADARARQGVQLQLTVRTSVSTLRSWCCASVARSTASATLAPDGAAAESTAVTRPISWNAVAARSASREARTSAPARAPRA